MKTIITIKPVANGGVSKLGVGYVNPHVRENIFGTKGTSSTVFIDGKKQLFVLQSCCKGSKKGYLKQQKRLKKQQSTMRKILEIIIKTQAWQRMQPVVAARCAGRLGHSSPRNSTKFNNEYENTSFKCKRCKEP